MRCNSTIGKISEYKGRMGVYQQIKDKFIMKNAREDWAEYRKCLTDVIIDRTKEASPKSIAIVGAGRCNDIDLERLTSYADQVYLLDVDADAMQEAVNSLDEQKRCKVECKTLSLTGITEEDMDTFCDGMLDYVRSAGRSLTTDSFRAELMCRLDEMLEQVADQDVDTLSRALPDADILVCCGVHSQLFTTLSFFIRSLIHSLEDVLPGVEALAEEVTAKLCHMDYEIIPVINEALCKAAGKYVIFGNEHMPDRPVEGAFQCIRDVKLHYNPASSFLRWDFNRAEGITYPMWIQICDVGEMR